MNEFKINLVFKDSTITFQDLMNDIFAQFVKNKINATCNNVKKELSYIQ